MDNYKDLLVGIFNNTVKDSIRVGKEEYKDSGVNFTNFTIKFTHIGDKGDDGVYEKIKQLIEMAIEDVTNNR